MNPPVKDLASRVFDRLDRSGRCWLWRGGRSGTGYGVVGINGRSLSVHRLVYEWTYGEIPAGMVVMHACDVPACCNPAHLRVGTHTDNGRDMVAKGRGRPDVGAAFNRNKTHCPSGHAYDAANTYVDRLGKRYCRQCHRAHLRAWRERRTAEA